MKNLIIIFFLLLTVHLNAQDRSRTSPRSCVKTSVITKGDKVTVTKNNFCTKNKEIKIYTKQQWKKILADRRKKNPRDKN